MPSLFLSSSEANKMIYSVLFAAALLAIGEAAETFTVDVTMACNTDNPQKVDGDVTMTYTEDCQTAPTQLSQGEGYVKVSCAVKDDTAKWTATAYSDDKCSADATPIMQDYVNGECIQASGFKFEFSTKADDLCKSSAASIAVGLVSLVGFIALLF